LAAIVLAGAALAFFYLGGGGATRAKTGPAPVPVDVALVTARMMPVTLDTIGTVQPEASVAIKPRTDGQIAEIHFAEGDDIKADQVLIVLDKRAAEAQLRQLEANLARDLAQLTALSRDRTRKEELVRKGVASVQALETAQSADQALAAAIRADQAAVETQKVLLDYLTIRAPISGRVGANNLKVGSTVKTTDAAPIVTINRLAPIDIVFAVPQRDLPAFRAAFARGHVGVRAKAQGEQRMVQGDVIFLDNQVDPTTGTLTAKAKIANSDLVLWPGQFIDVTVTLDQIPDVPSIPANAVSIGQDGPYVFVVDAQDRAQIRKIKVNRTAAGITYLDEGVNLGERVVVEGQSRVLPNGALTIRRSAEKGDSAS
jgi:multidrug efflux system membrane fusion protein